MPCLNKPVKLFKQTTSQKLFKTFKFLGDPNLVQKVFNIVVRVSTVLTFVRSKSQKTADFKMCSPR